MSLAWQLVRRIFWVNFSKPHRKSRLITQEQIITRKVKRRPFYAQIDKPSQTLFLATAHKTLSRPLISTNAARIFQSAQIRSFRTTLPRSVPPMFWVIFKPVGKLWAMLLGRYIRKWWAKVPHDKRSQYTDFLGGMKGTIIGVVTLVLLCVIVIDNYCVHLEENPVTGRKRFMGLTVQDQILVESEGVEKRIMRWNKFLAKEHQLSKVVSDCLWRILIANKEDCKEIQKLNWHISIIDDDQTKNAFVLPNGHIFVYSGLINHMQNINQLAFVLSHEISHAAMGHHIEHISRRLMLDLLMITVLAAIWTIAPGGSTALVTQWFYNKLIIKLMIDLPYSRELEAEADIVGLKFAAKACYDVRQAPRALWALKEDRMQYSDNCPIPEFMSTHPSYVTRMKQLVDRVPQALDMRDQCACPKLKTSEDPLQRVAKDIAIMKAIYESSNATQESSETKTSESPANSQQGSNVSQNVT